MQLQWGIWKRFIRYLIRGGRMHPQLGIGRDLLEVYQGWTDAASDGDLEKVY